MRNLLIRIVLMVACMGLLAGCASATGDSASNARRLQDIEREGEELRQSVEAVRASLEQLNKSLGALERNVDELKSYMEMPERIQLGAERIRRKLQSIEDKLGRLERQDPRAVRVKVTSRDNGAGPAQEVAGVLREKGYLVEVVGMASSKGYGGYEVIYSEGFADAARAIAREIGHGARTRPLTWSSVYDVIVVTGGKD